MYFPQGPVQVIRRFWFWVGVILSRFTFHDDVFYLLFDEKKCPGQLEEDSDNIFRTVAGKIITHDLITDLSLWATRDKCSPPYTRCQVKYNNLNLNYLTVIISHLWTLIIAHSSYPQDSILFLLTNFSTTHSNNYGLKLDKPT